MYEYDEYFDTDLRTKPYSSSKEELEDYLRIIRIIDRSDISPGSLGLMRYDSYLHARDVIDERRLTDVRTSEERYVTDMLTYGTCGISNEIYFLILVIGDLGSIL